MRHTPFRHPAFVLSTVTALLLGGCGDDDDDLAAAARRGQRRPACQLRHAGCRASGSPTPRSPRPRPWPPARSPGAARRSRAHCLVKGEMYRRTSPQDGKSYAIGFEMRLPNDWNGRFFYQANGGIDGSRRHGRRRQPGGGPCRTRCSRALPSSAPTPATSAQGRPELRHRLPGAAGLRLPGRGQADADGQGVIASRLRQGPGPLVHRRLLQRRAAHHGGRRRACPASTTASWSASRATGCRWRRSPTWSARRSTRRVATDPADIATGFTAAERALLSHAVLAKCDALDGATDGMVQDTTACQAAFDLKRDVPTCTGARDGSCLRRRRSRRSRRSSPGATTSSGAKFYASFPYDAGTAAADWAFWEFIVPLLIDSGAAAIIWGVPPADPATFNGPAYALTGANRHHAGRGRRRPTRPTPSPPCRSCSRVEPDEPGDAEEPRRQGDGLSRRQRPDLLGRRHDGLVRGPARGQRRRRRRTSRASTACPAWPTAPAARRPTSSTCSPPLVDWVEKGQAPDSVRRPRARRRQCGRRQRRRAGRLVGQPQPPAVPVPEGGALQGAAATDLESADSFSCQ